MGIQYTFAHDARFLPPEPDPTTVVLDESRKARLARMVGQEGLTRLTDACVMVLGLGGVGSNCVEALARGGVGSFIIVDHDCVQASNINRQAIAFTSTVGKPKIVAMSEMILDINPEAHVEAYQYFLNKDTIVEFAADKLERVDYIVDAIDTISAKLTLAAYLDQLESEQRCQQAMQHIQIPKLVSCMGAANKRYPECFSFADLYDTVNCPLCRIMRKEGRRRGISHLDVLYSSEIPVKAKTTQGATRQQRSNLGTMSYVPPIMGQMLAGYVIRGILHIPLTADRAMM